MNIIKALRANAALALLEPAEIEAFSKDLSLRQYERRSVVLAEGTKSGALFIVVSGLVKALKYLGDGRQISVDIFSAGDIVGETSVLSGGPAVYTAEVLEDSVLVPVLREKFMDLLSAHPEVRAKLYSTSLNRLSFAYEKLAEVMGEGTEQRLARGLMMLLSKKGAEIPFTGVDLASLTGTSLETIYRTTSSMRGNGIIRTGRGMITVIDKDKLNRIAEGAAAVC